MATTSGKKSAATHPATKAKAPSAAKAKPAAKKDDAKKPFKISKLPPNVARLPKSAQTAFKSGADGAANMGEAMKKGWAAIRATHVKDEDGYHPKPKKK